MSCCETKPPYAGRAQSNSAHELFVKYLLSSKTGIKKREAIEVGTRPIEYFRGIDFPKWVQKHRDCLQTKHSTTLAEATVSDYEKMDLNALANALGQFLIKNGYVQRAEHRPIAPLDQSAEACATSSEEAALAAQMRDNAKWPRRLGVCKDKQNFDAEGFYVILYEEHTSLIHLVLAAIIIGVLLACLFPIWPFRLKIAVYYMGVVLLTILIILSIIRLILFGVCWFAGCDFWFLPKLFNEDVGVIDSFIPLYTFEKRKDDWLMVGARIFLAVLCVGCFYKLSETHTLSDVGNVASKGFLDILDWGHQKLGDATPSDSVELETKEMLLTPEQSKARDWDSCVKHCEFADFEEFNDFCYTDCSCVEELWASNCWKKCTGDIQKDLTERTTKCTSVGKDIELEAVEELNEEL